MMIKETVYWLEILCKVIFLLAKSLISLLITIWIVATIMIIFLIPFAVLKFILMFFM